METVGNPAVNLRRSFAFPVPDVIPSSKGRATFEVKAVSWIKTSGNFVEFKISI
jgi:hypothetical protein